MRRADEWWIVNVLQYLFPKVFLNWTNYTIASFVEALRSAELSDVFRYC